MTLSVDLFFSFRSPLQQNEPFFGQDRIGMLVWRMESKGLTRRN